MFVIMISAAVLWPAVCLLGAGVAELCITVLDPSGQTIPFDVEPIQNGQRVTYIPDCPGTYKVNATYGGINVPGNLDRLIVFLSTIECIVLSYVLFNSISV